MVIDVSVVLVVGYFLATGGYFLVKPEGVSFYDMAPIGAAGRTEVRCYYGALALGIAAFLTYLGLNDLGREAVTGVLFLASAILVTRVIGAFVDDGWGEQYTRTAVPVEALFVVLLVGALVIG